MAGRWHVNRLAATRLGCRDRPNIGRLEPFTERAAGCVDSRPRLHYSGQLHPGRHRPRLQPRQCRGERRGRFLLRLFQLGRTLAGPDRRAHPRKRLRDPPSLLASGSSVRPPTVASNADGTAIAAWWQNVSGQGAGIGSARYTPSGGWAPPSFVAAPAGTFPSRPQVFVRISNSGRAILAAYSGEDFRGFDPGVGFSAVLEQKAEKVVLLPTGAQTRSTRHVVRD